METDHSRQGAETVTLGQRFNQEWKNKSYFNLIETDGRVLDVHNTFARTAFGARPKRKQRSRTWWLLICRIVAFVLTTAYFFWSWFEQHTLRINRLVYLAYLTRWNIIGILLFQFSTFIITIWPNHFLRQPSAATEPEFGKLQPQEDLHHGQINPPEPPEEKDEKESLPPTLLPHPLVRLVWILNSALIPLQFLVILAYWLWADPASRQHEIRNQVSEVVDHGVISVVFLLDGVVWHRIPVRLRHIMLTYVILVAYVVFYGIYTFTTTTGNGSYGWEDPDEESTSIYETGEWYQTMAMFGATGALFIPLVYGFSWCLSLLSYSSYSDKMEPPSSCCCCRGWALDGSHRWTVDLSLDDTMKSGTSWIVDVDHPTKELDDDSESIVDYEEGVVAIHEV